MPRPQDYIITRTQLGHVITELMTTQGHDDIPYLRCDSAVTPVQVVNEIFRQRDLLDARIIRDAYDKWEELAKEEDNDGDTQADN